MRKFFAHIYQKRLNSQAGVAALLAVIIAMVALSTIALNFLAETQQEQSGSALTYTSTNAQMIAEAGLRYAEKCLKKNVSGCPCYSTCTSANWPSMVNTSYASIPFGDTRGSFSFMITSATTSVARVKSTGTFAGAIREMYKNVYVSCPLAQTAITTCTAASTLNNAVISPASSAQSGQCNVPAITPVTFPTGYTGCPNVSYPSFTGGTVSSPYQYCSWNQASGTVTITGDVTVWVKGDFTLSNSSQLNINGNVIINVGGNTLIQNNAEVNITSGTLTFHSVGNFTLQNNATMNYPVGGSAGAASKLMVLIEGNGQILNNIQFSGALYGPNMTLDLLNNALFVGSIVSNSATLKNNATLTYDSTAGTSTSGYSICSSGSGSTNQFGGG